jgi:AcrR family transcriptional regulator
LPDRSEEGRSSPREESSKRQERADRILDAAAELLVRWGYKKTTVDDIARLAGVAKGTIYLHWKTREELFLTLLIREKLRAGRILQETLANDPDGLTLHGMIKYSVLSAMSNPLFKAIITRDREMLGEMVEDRYHGVDVSEQMKMFYHFLASLREQRLIRSDHAIEEQIHMLISIMMGFLLVDQHIPEEFQLPIEKRAELVGETIQRTFEIRAQDQQERRDAAASYEQMLQSMQEFLQKE